MLVRDEGQPQVSLGQLLKKKVLEHTQFDISLNLIVEFRNALYYFVFMIIRLMSMAVFVITRLMSMEWRCL